MAGELNFLLLDDATGMQSGLMWTNCAHLFCCWRSFPGQGRGEGLGETWDAEHGRPIFTPDQGCCDVMMTAVPQESVPSAQRYEDVAPPSLPFPRSPHTSNPGHPGSWRTHRVSKEAWWRVHKLGSGVRRVVFLARKSFLWLHKTQFKEP